MEVPTMSCIAEHANPIWIDHANQRATIHNFIKVCQVGHLSGSTKGTVEHCSWQTTLMWQREVDRVQKRTKGQGPMEQVR
jgi:hypothetical protein